MTFGTQPQQFQHVFFHQEAGAPLNPVDQSIQVIGAGKLDRLLALTAHKVMAVAQLGSRVTMTAVLKVDPADETHL